MSYEYLDDSRGYLQPRDPVVFGARPVRGRMANEGYARRPLYYSTGSGGLLSPEYSTGLHRSRSTGPRTAGPPSPAPVIINHISTEDGHHRGRPLSMYEPDDDYELRDPSPISSRGRSPRGRSPRRYHRHSRPMSVSYSREVSPVYRTVEEKIEYEAMKEKLKKLEHEKQMEEEQKRIKDEILLKQAKEAEAKLKEEKKKREISEKAVEDFKRKEADRITKEKKEKEQREKEYQERYRNDLERLGLTSRDASLVVRKEVDLSKTTFTKMARRHISIETLKVYGVNWKFDDYDSDYIIIKRWVPEHEQETFWEHTRQVRDGRANEERHQFFMRAQEEDRARRMAEEKKAKKKPVKRTGFFY
ncbi:MAG: hypothetical protein M1840_006794 [Geoglossum simile]|nr:MAG: hypothetical protein M1840_006794 [Geoglossum simile]